jgi:hypothetical protein
MSINFYQQQFEKIVFSKTLQEAKKFYSKMKDECILLNYNYIFLTATINENAEELKFMKWLYGINPNINISKNNDYAFRIFCNIGNTKFIKWLLKKKPTINIFANDDLNIPFINPYKFNNYKLLKYLIQLNTKYCFLHLRIKKYEDNYFATYANNKNSKCFNYSKKQKFAKLAK